MESYACVIEGYLSDRDTKREIQSLKRWSKDRIKSYHSDLRDMFSITYISPKNYDEMDTQITSLFDFKNINLINKIDIKEIIPGI